MTIEELLDCDANTLEKMTDAELLKHFEPYLKVTRPELAVKPETKSHARPINNFVSKEKQEKLEKARAVAKQFGLELGL